MNLDRESIMRLVRSRPLPERLLQKLAKAPLLVEHDLPPTGALDHAARRAGEGAPSPSELEVLRCLSHGLTPAMSAEVLGKSYETVRHQIKRARYVLRAKNTAHALAIALRRGLID